MKDKAYQLWLAGHSATAIAKMSGAPVSSVYEWSRVWRKEAWQLVYLRQHDQLNRMLRSRA